MGHRRLLLLQVYDISNKSCKYNKSVGEANQLNACYAEMCSLEHIAKADKYHETQCTKAVLHLCRG